MFYEVDRKGILHLKDGKATGPDELSAEALKALDEHNIEIIASLCNIIYNSGMIPTEMKHSDLHPLPTGLVKDCINILVTLIVSIVNVSLSE